jgi:hypothetical protein
MRRSFLAFALLLGAMLLLLCSLSAAVNASDAADVTRGEQRHCTTVGRVRPSDTYRQMAQWLNTCLAMHSAWMAHLCGDVDRWLRARVGE